MREILLFTTLLLTSCNSLFSPFGSRQPVEKFDTTDNIQLDDYWYQGEAQILTYNLVQNRYRDQHPGEVILIQVTEDFNTKEQVKSDDMKKDENTATVIKTNIIERFTTGVYDYSMMTSTFTGVTPPFPTYKITHSSQDWCGQSMVQVNLVDDYYVHRLFSYFESEGDQVNQVPPVLLEDEIFNLIRLAPEKIRSGKVKMVPAMKVLRLLHIAPDPQPTEIGIDMGQDTSSLTILMPQIERKRTISFLTRVPHTILGWEDTYQSVFDQQPRTTRAYLKAEKKIPYWQLNKKEDVQLRESLGLRLY